MTTEENKSYAEKNEDKIRTFVDNINDKGDAKKEEEKKEFEAAKEAE